MSIRSTKIGLLFPGKGDVVCLLESGKTVVGYGHPRSEVLQHVAAMWESGKTEAEIDTYFNAQPDEVVS